MCPTSNAGPFVDLRAPRMLPFFGLRLPPSWLRSFTLLLLASVPAAAETPAGQYADGIDGLPGLYRIGIAGTSAPRAGAGLWLQYGYTEPQNGDSADHHRFGGTVAAGGALWPYLSAAVRVDMRHDIHGADPMGSDSGTLIDVTPMLRAGAEVAPGIYLGGEGRLALSGAAASEGVAPPTFDGRLLAAGRFGQETLALLAGYRTPQGGSILTDAAMLRPGDRVVLGLSEYGAVLLGLGAQHSFGKTDVLAEVTWDLLVGDGAPPAPSSPLRIGLGARHTIIPGLCLHGQIEISPGDRAPSTTADPLVPVEPRFLALIGASVRFPDLLKKKSEAKPPPEEPPEEAPPPPPPPPPPAPASLRVTVVDDTGHPISDALVTLEIEHPGQAEPERRQVPLDQLNVYTLSELAGGEVDITVSAALLQPYNQHLVLVPGETADVSVRLAKDATQGAQLRGLVRDYSGAGLMAKVQVIPGDLVTTCNEQGEFVLDLPPGTYDVVITADGHQTQKRRLKVRREGVTVLNADLQTTK